MAVDEQRRPVAPGETANDDRAAGVRALGHAAERIGGDRLRHLEQLHREADPLELGRDDALRAGLVSDDAGLGHEALEERERTLGEGVDLGVDRIHQRRAGRSQAKRRSSRRSTSLRPTRPSGRR